MGVGIRSAADLLVNNADHHSSTAGAGAYYCPGALWRRAATGRPVLGGVDGTIHLQAATRGFLACRRVKQVMGCSIAGEP